MFQKQMMVASCIKLIHGKIRPSKALQDAVVSMINGNQEFYMIDEQKVVFSTVKKLLEQAMTKNEKVYNHY